jgi:CRP-like cAMP-binding protein
MHNNLSENLLLQSVPLMECNLLFPKLKPVDLPLHKVLTRTGHAVKHAYFITSGVASVLMVTAGGKSVEVGLTGNEGFVGLPLIVGFRSSPTQSLMQVAGSGLRITARDLMDTLEVCPVLTKCLQRYAQELAMQAMQVAACNRLHSVEARLARWLLMTQDRVDGDLIPLTQQFVAHMLGTRRASVTDAASALQKARLIAYTRGKVKVANRPGLEKASCVCYRQMNLQSRRWRQEVK